MQITCLLAVVFYCFTLGFSVAQAQGYPDKPIRLVVGFPPGGNVDLVARLISQKLSAQSGWQIVIDNKPGAISTIANGFIAKSDPDGYVVGILTAGSITATPYIMKVPYGLDDLLPVLKVASYESVLVVHPSVPAKTIKELVALAKKRPGILTFGSSGVGSTFHLAFEQLGSMAGVKMAHIPYKGAGPTLIDLIAGRIDSTVNSLAVMKPLIDQGRVRAIAVTGKKRNPLFPNVPTVGETYPGYIVDSWMGLFVPKNTPAAIVLRLNTEVTKALREPDMEKSWKKYEFEFSPNSPMEFGKLVKEESIRYGALIKKLGLKPEYPPPNHPTSRQPDGSFFYQIYNRVDPAPIPGGISAYSKMSGVAAYRLTLVITKNLLRELVRG